MILYVLAIPSTAFVMGLDAVQVMYVFIVILVFVEKCVFCVCANDRIFTFLIQ